MGGLILCAPRSQQIPPPQFHRMDLRVRCFGPLAEEIGSAELHLSFDGAVVSDLIAHLGLEAWVRMGLSVAVDGTMVPHDAPLVDGGEVVLLPPVSGG